MSRTKSKASIVSVLASICVFLALVAGLLFIWIYQQEIRDRFVAWRYEPSSEVARIVERTTMTEHGTLLFYASQPELLGSEGFNTYCDRPEPTSAILGCYRNQRIYVYQVDNNELDGVEEVTAAHEMLHAVWDRMSASERESIGSLLEAEYAKLDDASLDERMAYYERQQAGTRTNELHSILGTEVRDLSDELEAHYRNYFSNRQAVVALHQQYSGTFLALQTRSERLQQNLTQLKQAIDTSTRTYSSDVTSLNAQITALNQQATSVDRTNPQAVNAYNSEVSRLRVQAAALNARRQQIEADIIRYNEMVREYNQTVLHTNRLFESLDSNVTPAPQL